MLVFFVCFLNVTTLELYQLAQLVHFLSAIGFGETVTMSSKNEKMWNILNFWSSRLSETDKSEFVRDGGTNYNM